jgi:hypothetical protein
MDRRGTEIAGRNVPVESGEITTIDFSGGPQPGDAGPKDFWVIFNERDAYIARWRHGEDPGERFRIMENESKYSRFPVVGAGALASGRRSQGASVCGSVTVPGVASVARRARSR